MNAFKFEIGAVLKDVITQFTGVVMARTQYFTGCVHYGLELQKLAKDGQIRGQYEWIDESRLMATGKHINLPGKTKEVRSGPHPSAPTLR